MHHNLTHRSKAPYIFRSHLLNLPWLHDAMEQHQLNHQNKLLHMAEIR